ncbi:MAG: hypothetical protein B6245_04170 [Desulfobacteraceae bacterium 4572_88]|nr:MAG: hypothetical protein B6245_04170 [Desulfobacteraceae bacterium 4572_88]
MVMQIDPRYSLSIISISYIFLSCTQIVLFNPREQNWSEHFRRSDDGLHIIGLTAIGRATVNAQMKDAEDQVRNYGDALERKYDRMRLRRYAVVSLGFERLWWKEIGRLK